MESHLIFGMECYLGAELPTRAFSYVHGTIHVQIHSGHLGPGYQKVSIYNGDNQGIERRLRLRRAAMDELGKLTKTNVVSSETKVKIIHTLVLPITLYACENWIVKKDEGGKSSFGIWRRSLKISWTTRKMNKWVLEQIKPEILQK